VTRVEATTRLLFDLGRFQVIAVSPWYFVFRDGYHGRTRVVDARN
jgi:hypothetical protein